MGKVLIIGAGGVGNVVAHKCAQAPEIFSDIMLASKTLEKCEKIRRTIKKPIYIAQVDADKVEELVDLINNFKPDIVINVALPYQDLTIMEACYRTGVHYLDTANYESPDSPRFRYKEQWDYDQKFKEKGIMAILGCGFDPGVSNIFCAYAQKNLFDEIKTIDILDCNAGDHGKAFATNFNPELNIREVTQAPKYWEKGKWIETPTILEKNSVHFSFDYPEVGKKESYLLYHEEMECLVKNIKGLERIRFWMTFSENYLNYLRVLQNLGLIDIEPVEFEGNKIIPLKFLKKLLPEPSSLGENYTGKTVIGCVFEGVKNGKTRKVYIYNICDHSACYREVNSQAVCYTAGVPAMLGAMMVLKGIWKGRGIFNLETLDPDPFMENLGKYGLPWIQIDFQGSI